MEKPPVMISHTQFFQLTDKDDLEAYASLLSKINSNTHKYKLVDNDVRLDMFGNPFIIFQYGDIEEEEEKIKKKFDFFGEIISIINLSRYDELTTDHWAEKIKMTLVKEYTTKDKENPMHYKLVIYYKINEGNTLEEKNAIETMPVDKRK